MNDLTANSGIMGEWKWHIAAWQFSVTLRNTLYLDSDHKSLFSERPFTTTYSIIRPEINSEVINFYNLVFKNQTYL